jgi:hypothetical protein
MRLVDRAPTAFAASSRNVPLAAQSPRVELAGRVTAAGPTAAVAGSKSSDRCAIVSVESQSMRVYSNFAKRR